MALHSSGSARAREARALFICGSRNQTTQMEQIAAQLPEFERCFTPYYGSGAVMALRRPFAWLAEPTIVGERRRAACVAHLQAKRLPLDIDGRQGPYDLVVTCSDLFVPDNVRRAQVVLVQEGMTDPDTWLSRGVKRAKLPTWMAGGTQLTGLSGRYHRFCVASRGYRDFFAARGAPADKLRVTGIPNFDDCRSYCDNALPYRGYVLACTSDLRETLRWDRRDAFIRRVVRIARGRPIRFKLHPNEREARARREIARWAPDAQVHTRESAEQLIANCDVLVTQTSSVVYVGIALGKEVHTDLDIDALRRLCPEQNGGQSAVKIAALCRRLLFGGAEPVGAGLTCGAPAAQAVRSQ